MGIDLSFLTIASAMVLTAAVAQSLSGFCLARVLAPLLVLI